MTDLDPTTGSDDAPDGGGQDADDGATSLRLKAVLTAVLLLVTGAALGVTVDRLWVSGPPASGASPLTVDAMARSLELGPRERGRVRRLLDSLEVEVAEAARAGPDSLRTVARRSRARLEGALPPHLRRDFREWMRGHHRRMMERMHGGGMMGPMHREGMGPTGSMRGSGGGPPGGERGGTR